MPALPAPVVKKAEDILKSITWDGQPLLTECKDSDHREHGWDGKG